MRRIGATTANAVVDRARTSRRSREQGRTCPRAPLSSAKNEYAAFCGCAQSWYFCPCEGPFLVLIAIVIIGVNEKRAIDTYKDIQDDRNRVVEVKCGTTYSDITTGV